MRQKRRGDDICTKSRVDNLSDGKKVWGGRKERERERGEGSVKRNARKSKRGEGDGRKEESVRCAALLRTLWRSPWDCTLVVIFCVLQFPPSIPIRSLLTLNYGLGQFIRDLGLGGLNQIPLLKRLGLIQTHCQWFESLVTNLSSMSFILWFNSSIKCF